MVQLLFTILLVAHWGACFLFYIGYNECVVTGLCWLQEYSLIDASVYEQYIASFYFFIETMTTVGYGDFRPISPNERLYQIFCMLISCGIFAYIIGSLGKILSTQFDAENRFKEKIMVINKFLSERDVNDNLRIKIKTFLEHKLETNDPEGVDENMVFDLINRNLREDIIKEIEKKLLSNFQFISEYEKFCIKVTKILKDETIYKNEVIFDVKNIINYFDREVNLATKCIL